VVVVEVSEKCKFGWVEKIVGERLKICIIYLDWRGCKLGKRNLRMSEPKLKFLKAA